MSRFLLPSGTVITDDLRPAWKAARNFGVGASEVADLCGFGYRSPLDLYLRKTGQLGPVEETQAMRIGTLCEPIIRALWEDQTDRPISREQVFVHHDLTGLFATLDAVCEDGGIVEFKTVGLRAAWDWGPDGTDEVPDHYLFQAHAQMIAADRDEVTVAALMGTELRTYTVRYSTLTGDLVRREVERFLDRLDRQVPPEPMRPSDAALMPYLHPEAEGKVELGADALCDAAEFIGLGERIATDSKRRDLLKAKLDAAMAGGKTADLPDGRTLTRRVQHQQAGESIVRRQAKSWTVFSVRTAKGGDHGDGE